MSLGNDYFAARGILPETLSAAGVEIDEVPCLERILERLRRDTEIDGIALSRLVQEIIWFRSADPRA